MTLILDECTLTDRCSGALHCLTLLSFRCLFTLFNASDSGDGNCGHTIDTLDFFAISCACVYVTNKTFHALVCRVKVLLSLICG